MAIQDALSRLIIDYDETTHANGEVHARGSMRFGEALEGPPGRLHGGHHAFVRTLPILARVTAHEHVTTFPCAVDVAMRQGLPLDDDVPFDAVYRRDADGWELATRFQETDRLQARARSISDQPLMGDAERERWRQVYLDAQPGTDSFQMFGFTVHLSPTVVWVESRDPSVTLPESQHAALVRADGMLGPAFVATQLDTVGATARGALMRHPHFTTHMEINFATGSIPASTRLICLADRTGIEELRDTDAEPVEVNGVVYGTARTPVALVDAGFERVFATGRVTVHPVHPAKFAALQRMRQIRSD